MSVRARLLTTLLVGSVSSELACAHARRGAVERSRAPRCSTAFSDTTGWQHASSVVLGAEFLMPPGYRRKEWESSRMPQRPPTEDWLPGSSVLWTIELTLDSIARPAVPPTATDVMHCTLSDPSATGDAWSYRHGEMVVGHGSPVVPFVVHGQWRRSDGRWLHFAAEGPDSAGAERMLRIVASLRLIDRSR